MKTVTHSFGKSIHTSHFVNPGSYLNDIELKTMFQQLLDINNNRDNPIKHKLIDRRYSSETVREIYSKAIVGIVYLNHVPAGFLISPILENNKFQVVHAGLTVISRNAGDNLLGLLSMELGRIIATQFPNAYITNISSTPSILENFAKHTTRTWPDPDAKLIRAPRNYNKVFDLLFEEYVLNFFDFPDQLVKDRKRFVIQSRSEKMGFNTNLRQLSKSANFKYFSFCFAWLDYEKEEDLVQVARMGFWMGMKLHLIHFALKYLVIPYMNKKDDQRESQNVAEKKESVLEFKKSI